MRRMFASLSALCLFMAAVGCHSIETCCCNPCDTCDTCDGCDGCACDGCDGCAGPITPEKPGLMPPAPGGWTLPPGQAEPGAPPQMPKAVDGQTFLPLGDGMFGPLSEVSQGEQEQGGVAPAGLDLRWAE